jgi:hypothetical protein
LRIQCNANHDDASIDGLISAFGDLTEIFELTTHADSLTAVAVNGKH